MDKTLTFWTKAMIMPLTMNFTLPTKVSWHKQDQWQERKWQTCQRYRWQKHD
jgi:hypothetical protein